MRPVRRQQDEGVGGVFRCIPLRWHRQSCVLRLQSQGCHQRVLRRRDSLEGLCSCLRPRVRRRQSRPVGFVGRADARDSVSGASSGGPGRDCAIHPPHGPSDSTFHSRQTEVGAVARGGEAGHHPPCRDTGTRSERAPEVVWCGRAPRHSTPLGRAQLCPMRNREGRLQRGNANKDRQWRVSRHREERTEGLPTTSANSNTRRNARCQSATADFRSPFPLQKKYPAGGSSAASASTAALGSGT